MDPKVPHITLHHSSWREKYFYFSKIMFMYNTIIHTQVVYMSLDLKEYWLMLSVKFKLNLNEVTKEIADFGDVDSIAFKSL